MVVLDRFKWIFSLFNVVLIYYFFSDCHALPRGKSKIDRKENEKYEAMHVLSL